MKKTIYSIAFLVNIGCAFAQENNEKQKLISDNLEKEMVQNVEAETSEMSINRKLEAEAEIKKINTEREEQKKKEEASMTAEQIKQRQEEVTKRKAEMNERSAKMKAKRGDKMLKTVVKTKSNSKVAPNK